MIDAFVWQLSSRYAQERAMKKGNTLVIGAPINSHFSILAPIKDNHVKDSIEHNEVVTGFALA